MKRMIPLLLGMLAIPALALEVNSATQEELVAAGFSSTQAQNIIQARTLGLFHSSADLLGIDGITQGSLNRVRAVLTVDGRRITTPSGTAPAIPGVGPAIPGKPTALVASSRRRGTAASHTGGARRPASSDPGTDKGGKGGGKGGHGRR